MKFALALAVLLSPISAIADSQPEMSCLHIMGFDQNESGRPSWYALNLSVVIHKSASGEYGFVADVTEEGKKTTVADVKIETPDLASLDNLKDTVALLAPDVNFADIKSVRVGNVGVKQNEDDANGIVIYQLFNAEGRELAKLTTVGWGFGQLQPLTRLNINFNNG